MVVDRQKDRQTDRQTGRQTDRQIDRKTRGQWKCSHRAFAEYWHIVDACQVNRPLQDLTLFDTVFQSLRPFWTFKVFSIFIHSFFLLGRLSLLIYMFFCFFLNSAFEYMNTINSCQNNLVLLTFLWRPFTFIYLLQGC